MFYDFNLARSYSTIGDYNGPISNPDIENGYGDADDILASVAEYGDLYELGVDDLPDNVTDIRQRVNIIVNYTSVRIFAVVATEDPERHQLPDSDEISYFGIGEFK